MTEENWQDIEDEGFVGLVGPIQVGSVDDRSGRFRFHVQPKHKNLRGVLQGGMLMTFADRAMGMTVRRGDPTTRTATVQLDVHFIDATQVGETVEAQCRILRRTKSIVFVDAAFTVDGRLVATARGTWKLLKPA